MMTMPMLERCLYFENVLRLHKAGDLAVALSFFSADADTELALGEIASRKGLFTESSRAQHERLCEVENKPTEPTLQRFIQLRRLVASHVIDWQRGDSEKEVEPQTVETLFREIQDVEGKLLRSIDGGGKAGEDWSGLGPRIAKTLHADETVLEFVRFTPIDLNAVRALDIQALVSDDPKLQHYGVFLFSGALGRVFAVDLGAAASLDDAVLEYRALQERQSSPGAFDLDETALAAAAEPLRKRLIEPISRYLVGVRRIYIAPEGQLSVIPFEAIPVRADAGGPRYLVEDHEVVYISTVRDLLRFEEHPKATSSREACLFGDPDFDAMPASGFNFDVLPQTLPRVDTSVAASGLLLAKPQQMSLDGTELTRWPRLAGTRNVLGTLSEVIREVRNDSDRADRRGCVRTERRRHAWATVGGVRDTRQVSSRRPQHTSIVYAS